MAQLTDEQRKAEEQMDLGILRRVRKTVDSTNQPSQEAWDMAARTVVLATMNSVSDLALAARAGSRTSTITGTEDSYTPDGTGLNRHIPRPLRQPITPPSVAAAIEDALPDVALDVPAAYRVAMNTFGLWACEVNDCGHFIDPSRLRAAETEFVREYVVGQTGVVVNAEGVGHISNGRAMAARAALQLLVYHHYETAHLFARGLEMVVAPAIPHKPWQLTVTWKWRDSWLASHADARAGANGDERRLTQVLRHWVADKGARVSERLRRPLLAVYRKWARADRLERQRVVQKSKKQGDSDYEAAHMLYGYCRVSDRTADAIAAFDAHARAEELDEDIAHFDNYPRQPWPRDAPYGWNTLSDAEKDELRAVWASADHMRLVEVERRVYGYPWLVNW